MCKDTAANVNPSKLIGNVLIKYVVNGIFDKFAIIIFCGFPIKEHVLPMLDARATPNKNGIGYVLVLEHTIMTIGVNNKQTTSFIITIERIPVMKIVKYSSTILFFACEIRNEPAIGKNPANFKLPDRIIILNSSTIVLISTELTA